MIYKAVALSLLTFAVPLSSASAHHSFAMFDGGKTLVVEGTVKRLDWANPHIWLYVAAPDPDGKIYSYGLETGGPAQLAQRGWSPGMVQPGDKVILTIHPIKDGSHGGELMAIKLPNGKTIYYLPQDQPDAHANP